MFDPGLHLTLTEKMTCMQLNLLDNILANMSNCCIVYCVFACFLHESFL